MTGDLGPAAAAVDQDVYARLIADPALLDCDELYFNAWAALTGRLRWPVRITCGWPASRIARIIAT